MRAIRRWNRGSGVLWWRRSSGSATCDRRIAMKVGVIGLGSMGMGAALNLHRKGHVVTGCEPRESARAEFLADGGQTVNSADKLPPGLEAVVVFVINAAQTEDVLFGPNGCLSKLEKGTVILCCATVSPDAARSLGKKIEDAGFLMVDSP